MDSLHLAASEDLGRLGKVDLVLEDKLLDKVPHVVYPGKSFQDGS